MKLLLILLLTLGTKKQDLTIQATHTASSIDQKEYTKFIPCFLLIRIEDEEINFVSKMNTRRYKILRKEETYIDYMGDAVTKYYCRDEYGQNCTINYILWYSVNKRQTISINYRDVNILYMLKPH